MTKLEKIYQALIEIKKLDMFDNCSAIATMHNDRHIPEHYKFVKDYVTMSSRVSVYDMDMVGAKSYLVVIPNLGNFQVF